MNLLGFNIQITRPRADKQLETASTKRSFTPQEWLAGEDIAHGGALLSNAYEQVVWVYRAINALAEQVANVPFVFSSGERGRENLITSGPLLDFYARPHAQLNRFQYWELRIMWLMLRGECMRVPIWETAHNSHPSHNSHSAPRSRRLRSLLILDPARFQHIIEDHQLIGWRYTGFGPRAPLASQVFLPEEVWFEKLPNPFDFWRGFPPLYVAGTAAQTDFAAGAFMRGIIENNADTGVIVRTDKWLSDEQREQILGALRERKRRAGSADRPVLLLGSAEVLKPQLSSSDLQFLDNRKFSRAEICAAFGVPEEIVTSTEHAKYDVMTGARLNFIENRVAPLCSRLEAEEDVTVKSIDPGASGWFDLDSLPIMQEARRSRLAAARTGFQMGVPFNELNRVLDLGFKPLPWGDKGYLPATLQELASGKGGEKSEIREAIAKPNVQDKSYLNSPHPDPLPKEREQQRADLPNERTVACVGRLTTILPLPREREQQRADLAKGETVGLGARLTTILPLPSGEGRGEGNSAQPLPIRLRSLGIGSRNPKSEIQNADPAGDEEGIFDRAHSLLSELSNHQLSTIDYKLLRRLRRFLFEQRRRVLQKLNAMYPSSEVAVPGGSAESMAVAQKTPEELLNGIFDLEKENQELWQRVGPEVSSEPGANRQWLSRVNEALRAALLGTLRQANLSHGADLAARLKAFYNHITPQRLADFGGIPMRAFGAPPPFGAPAFGVPPSGGKALPSRTISSSPEPPSGGEPGEPLNLQRC